MLGYLSLSFGTARRLAARAPESTAGAGMWRGGTARLYRRRCATASTAGAAHEGEDARRGEDARAW